MMTTQSKTLDLKIQIIQATVRQILESHTGAEPEAEQIDSLLDVLNTYELALMRQKLKLPTTAKQIQWIKQSIRDAGCLLVDLGQDEPEQMAGWYHGAIPKNTAYALANLLSRIILELSGIVWAGEQQFPELKEQFDAERKHHAKLIQEAEQG
jgi:hypothetical protein